MRTILYLIRKEFLQIFRDKFIGKAIFAIPIVQMLILVPAVTFEIRHVRMCIIDLDRSVESGALVAQLEGSSFFRVTQATFSEKEAQEWMHRGQCDLILQIPSDFGKNVGNGVPTRLMVSANAINASHAQLSWAYVNGIIRDFNLNLLAGKAGNFSSVSPPKIEITQRYWYNETLNYKYYMLPGVLGILVTAIAFVLAGINLVKEKESGTIEQINVTPVKKYQFMTAKIVPFLLIGLVDLALGIVIGRLVFGIPFVGSATLLFFVSFIFMIAALGLALFISTFTHTQQQFMFAGFFFMIIFMLMSGIFTPLESMPEWARNINLLNPVAYIMRINRMVMLKGSTLSDISGDIYALTAIAVVATLLAVWKYRKTA